MSISLDSEGVASHPRTAPPLSRHALRAEPTVAVSGPVSERFWNAPNTITVLRAAVVPVLLLVPLFPSKRGAP
jgi:hypothetical protein